MKFISLQNWGLKIVLASMLIAPLHLTHAEPTRDEKYRRADDIARVIVYGDDRQNDVFWYVPPVKLLPLQDGKTYYKITREDTGMIEYYFYIMPYMTPSLMEMISAKIPEIKNASQLRPVTIRKLGISIKRFNTFVLSEEMTDIQVLNVPQYVKFSFNAAEAANFEFFLTHKPGILANMIYTFNAQKIGAFITVEMSHKQVYQALNATGHAEIAVTKADIEAAILLYKTDGKLQIAGKGDLPIPAFIDKIIQECFEPISNGTDLKDEPNKGDRDNDFYYNDKKPNFRISAEESYSQSDRTSQMDAAAYEKSYLAVQNIESLLRTDGSMAAVAADAKAGAVKEITFKFKANLKTSDKKFLFEQIKYQDDTITTALPVFLTEVADMTDNTVMHDIRTQKFVVNYKNNRNNIVRTGIVITGDERLSIATIGLTAKAKSPYSKTMSYYNVDKIFNPNVYGAIYYRVGNMGTWMPIDERGSIDRRAMITDDDIARGELQFYMDRGQVWDNVYSTYTRRDFFGLFDAIFEYNTFYPTFTVEISGKKYGK